MSNSKQSGTKTNDDEPLEVRLTIKVNFGDEPNDALTVMDDQKLYMAGSVFEYRDRIVRFFTVTLFRVAMTDPVVAREFLPGLIFLMQKAGKLVPGRG